ncbi:MAG TPA: ELWxxDGT repeat protein, partial [Gemmataceae bacterium]|nr:ELWxxDGT repeat protein [Gemmataceae bacterium]
MKTSFWRRWCNSLFGATAADRVSRARRRRLGLNGLEDRVTPTLTPQMVLDINATTLSANPSGLVAVGSTTFFAADDGVHGPALWKSDGTETGTVLVKNVNPSNLTAVNGTLFFTLNDGIHSWGELWKSDGTTAGTVRVGSLGSSASDLTAVNGTLFFSAYAEATGWELWKSDGTPGGTVLVKDVVPGWDGSHPRELTNVSGTLFFSIHDYFNTYSELWKSDGTAAGTVRVKDFVPYIEGDNYARNLAGVNGTLFFTVKDATHGWELWTSNGTAAGTVLVRDLYPGVPSSLPGNMTNVNGTLYFTAEDGTRGLELWKSDGTAAGTVLVKDVYPGGGGASLGKPTVVNGMMYFTADDGIHGRELWKSDGTAAGTVLVKDIVPNDVGSGPGLLTDVNGTLFFTVPHSNVNGTPSFSTSAELWKSDGTTAGTVLVKEIDAGSAYASLYSLTNVNGILLFSAGDVLHGREVWKSDGTAAGTGLVTDINTRTAGASAELPVVVGGTMFFVADDGVHGRELWKSDGTVAGTTLVKDIYPGGGWLGNPFYGYSYQVNSSSPVHLTAVNGTLFFTADDGTGGWKLWKSDGTAAGTVPVDPLHWYPANLTAVGATLFFTASDGANGTELWKSDGTTAGTVLVKDIYPGSSYYSNPYGGGAWYPNSSAPAELTSANGTLFFVAGDEAHGRELWTSDGTAAGTVLVRDIRPGPGSSDGGLKTLTDVNGTLFFLANDGTAGYELWKSDGTPAGTGLVKDIRPGATGSYAHSLAAVDGTLFFAATDGTAGYELWKSDGTVSGTVLVKDINPGGGNSYPYPGGPSLYWYLGQHPTSISGTLFFTAYNPTSGRELWKSDGTAAGTVLVKDMIPGSASAQPWSGEPFLTNLNGTLFFTAYDAAGASNLWQTDGTEAGTTSVATHVSGPLTNFGGTLYFSTDDGVHGRELWKLVEDGTQETNLSVSGFPATVTAGADGSFTVTARLPDGSVNAEYRGTVRFTSTDPQAVLPADYTFTAADQGVHTFSATLKTAGSQSISISDPTPGVVSGTQSGITVTPAAASTFAITGFPTSVTAGLAWPLTVTAYDAFGNRATGYTG